MEKQLLSLFYGSCGSFIGFSIVPCTIWNSFIEIVIKCFISLLFGVLSVIISNMIIPALKRKFKIDE
jgi:hypothetical protein